MISEEFAKKPIGIVNNLSIEAPMTTYVFSSGYGYLKAPVSVQNEGRVMQVL